MYRPQKLIWISTIINRFESAFVRDPVLKRAYVVRDYPFVKRHIDDITCLQYRFDSFNKLEYIDIADDIKTYLTDDSLEFQIDHIEPEFDEGIHLVTIQFGNRIIPRSEDNVN